MQVRDGMSATVLTVGPATRFARPPGSWPSARSAPRSSSTPSSPAPGSSPSATSSTRSARARTPTSRRSATTSPRTLTFAAPDWSLERAAEAMVRGGFRHLVVVDGGETVGVLSMRDIVRCWTDDGASCEVDDKLSAA